MFHFVAMDNALTDEDDMEFFIFCAQSVALICVIGYYYSYGLRNRVHESSLLGNGFVNEMIIGHERVSFDLLRMNTSCWLRLCDELRSRHLLCDSRNVSVEEQVTIFLYTIGHNVRNRVMQNRFQHSGETISRYFNKVLNAIVMLSKHYITPPTQDTPLEISSKSICYPYFKVLCDEFV